MLGKLFLLVLLLVPLGILLGLTENVFLDALAAILFVAGNTALITFLLLGLAFLLRGLLFRGPDRYTRFN